MCLFDGLVGFPLEDFDDRAVAGFHHIGWPVSHELLLAKNGQVIAKHLEKLLVLPWLGTICGDDEKTHLLLAFRLYFE
jgi:hypothetical protein